MMLSNVLVSTVAVLYLAILLLFNYMKFAQLKIDSDVGARFQTCLTHALSSLPRRPRLACRLLDHACYLTNNWLQKLPVTDFIDANFYLEVFLDHLRHPNCLFCY